MKILNTDRQHPHVSRITNSEKHSNVRGDTKVVTTVEGIRKKRKTSKCGWRYRTEAISDLLSNPLWSQLQLSIHFFHENAMEQFRLKHKFDRTPLLDCFFADFHQVDNIHIQSTIYNKSIEVCTENNNKGSPCGWCNVDLKVSMVYCSSCNASLHITCAARSMKSSTSHLIPIHFTCPWCSHSSSWTEMVRRNEDIIIAHSSERKSGKEEVANEEEEEEEDELSCQSISSNTDDDEGEIEKVV